MSQNINIGIVGDFSDDVVAHKAIPVALEQAAALANISLNITWLPTDQPVNRVEECDALWFTPGSPYKNTNNVLDLIQQARERYIPTLGTCGGCQHILWEWALNVLGWKDATHAELQTGGRPVISPLVCSLHGTHHTLHVKENTRLGKAYTGAISITAPYQCGFGINQAYREDFFGKDELVINTLNDDGDVRGFELASHPFMVATMFQSERDALEGKPVPLAEALINAALMQQ